MKRRNFVLGALAGVTLPIAARADDLLDGITDSLGDLGSTGSSTSGSGGGDLGAGLSNGEIDSGLREALRLASERTVDQVGAVDGFNGDPSIHIPLPDSLDTVQSALKTVGMSDMADDLELKINRAAEEASGEAVDVFFGAIDQMTLDDARGILNGPDDAATQYFRRTTSDDLKTRMRPIVDSSLSDVGAIQSYDAMMGEYDSIPFVPDVKADLTDYALDGTLDGIFHYLAEQETAIRTDPVARSTELLQQVFGG
ncbi:MAG: DUF4197 domain-containing protein [Pseudomonadota bacterium]